MYLVEAKSEVFIRGACICDNRLAATIVMLVGSSEEDGNKAPGNIPISQTETSLDQLYYADMENNRCINELTLQPSISLRRRGFESIVDCCEEE